MPSAVVVVPCYDEEARLQPDRFLTALEREPRASFLFVDDGSKDGTFGVLQRLAERAPERIGAMSLAENSGKAEAVRQGMIAASAAGPSGEPPELVGFWDADLATPLEEIPRFIDTFDDRPRLGAVLGSRVKLLGRRVERKPSRHIIGRGMATLISRTLAINIYDSQCGAKLFRVEPILARALEARFASRWIFDVELLARLRDGYRAAGRPLGDAFYELPLSEWRDVAGSKLKLRDGFIALRDLAEIRRRYPWT